MCLSMLDIWLWHSPLVSLLDSLHPSVMGKCARVCSKKASSKVLKKPVGQITKKLSGAIVPKKGKARSLRRPSCSTSRSTSNKGVKYIQHNDKPEKKTKGDVNMMFFMTASQKQIIEKLKHTGWLSIIKKCPSCQSSLANHRHRRHGCWQARCPTKKCGKRISWTCHHPRNLPLGQQAAIYLGILLGCNQFAMAIQLGVTKSTIQIFAERPKVLVAKFVAEQQSKIKYGVDGDDWQEVEVAEVILGKEKVGKDKYKWSNFIGMIRRGSPSSLWLSRLPDRTTSFKAPGPGPIRSNDWVPIAKQMVADKGVILHGDSAKAYMKPFARMTHTHTHESSIEKNSSKVPGPNPSTPSMWRGNAIRRSSMWLLAPSWKMVCRSCWGRVIGEAMVVRMLWIGTFAGPNLSIGARDRIFSMLWVTSSGHEGLS